MDKKTVGQRIKELRKERGWTQQQLAKKVNVSSQVVSNWERGYTDPDYDDIARLSLVFETSADYILLGRDDDQSSSVPDKDEFDDPEIGLWFKDLKNASPEELRKLKQIWDLINEKEKDRKPGQKQGE